MNLDANREIELVKLAGSGDRDAFGELVRSCAGNIFNLAVRLTGNPAKAEDLAQDAFVKAFKNISKFQHKSSFSTWAYSITVNLWKNRVKYEKRRFFLKHLSLDKFVETDDGEVSRELPDSSPGPLDEIQEKLKSETIQQAVNELDEHTRSMIVLRDIELRSYEEIAEILGVPLGTVKSRIARARDALKGKLSKYMKGNNNGL